MRPTQLQGPRELAPEKGTSFSDLATCRRSSLGHWTAPGRMGTGVSEGRLDVARPPGANGRRTPGWRSAHSYLG